MKRRSVLVLGLTLTALAGGTFALAGNSEAAQFLGFGETKVNKPEPPPVKPASQPQQSFAKNAVQKADAAIKENQQTAVQNAPPDYVVYDVLFNTVKMLNGESAKLEAEGKNGKLWDNYFEKREGLTREQIAALRQVADEYTRNLEPIHTQAMKIIAERRAVYENGSIPEGKQPLPPSEELGKLESQRQQLALQHRDRLQQVLGEESFAQFNQAIKQNFAAKMHVLDAETRRQLDEKANKFAESLKLNQTIETRQANEMQGGQKQ